ncbi:1-deoxy-D-xylulose-5-phosphate reductoisomerase [Ereboglobus sp. PH5-5]|uniref:1-deoxy-D-xylulose-5-phosphate reductoisomerase n=1 Tax=Ereboglobus sp. PH5-5 TaxID=2940529 RepID=UPI002405C4A4|nr:1-deoxy-D-xylulose-5-phosphate reductoisomerase [Ereboglobus sp. PH5-5]MDF9834246.1 1-deoxy-D-xylulose-5-phosphate reductoisomerase [Ereboglobus sp. PH5-5]
MSSDHSSFSIPHSSLATRRRRVALLGATGSIGENTLRVIAAHPDQLELVAVAAHSNWEKLAGIVEKFRVPHAALFDEKARSAFQSKIPNPKSKITLHAPGVEGLLSLAKLPEADTVLVAVVGTQGLHPALAAIEAGKTLALASKEILVLAGKFVMDAARHHNAQLIPVDSEHNAVFQCLAGRPADAAVRRVTLTASGGAFRDWSAERLATATPADALRHPNWAMGPKITVDCATLANKGLELIEAQVLFGLRPEQCAAVLHPQSIVHALVEFTDGAMLAQLCPPSMTFPIQHALLHPARSAAGTESALDLDRLLALEFRPVDETRFPMLALAKQTMRTGGSAPAIYNAANEIAVAAFLENKLPFPGIPRTVEKTLAALAAEAARDPATLDTVLALDAEARRVAETFL